MRYIILITIIGLSGCDSSPEYRDINKVTFDCSANVEKVAVFTLSCIENANPKSDEEPEGWIGDCKAMAKDIYCTQNSSIVRQQKLPFAGGWEDIGIVKIK